MGRYRSFSSSLRLLAYAARNAERAQKAAKRDATREARDRHREEMLRYDAQQKEFNRQAGGQKTGLRPDGREFELTTAGLLESLGWQTQLTPATGDFGADIVATFESEILVVQCKDWATAVGLPAVQEVAFAKLHYQAQHGIVVSRAGFTKAAYTAAASANVSLFQQDQLHRSFLNRRGANQSRGARTSRVSDVDLVMTAYHKLVQEKEAERIPSFNLFRWAKELISQVHKKIQRAPDASGTASGTPDVPNQRPQSTIKIIRHCVKCHAGLRLESGKEGNVKCPVCGNIEFHQT